MSEFSFLHFFLVLHSLFLRHRLTQKERFTEAILISEFNPILGGIAGGWLIVWLLKGLLVECRWQTVADLGKMVEV